MKAFNPEKPYNELPLLPPEVDLETPRILKACIEANKELAKLKVAERLIPNQTVLINCIPLLESQASSAIENIVTTTDELFEHAQSVFAHSNWRLFGAFSTALLDASCSTFSSMGCESAKRVAKKSLENPLNWNVRTHSHNSPQSMTSATKETLQYRQALYRGFQSIKERPLSIAVICDICSKIRQIDTNIRNFPGTALVNDASGEKIYTPPEGEERIRQLLSNWQHYLHQNDGIDPLIKLAVQHYQFEAIHPFADGNGRTGRIINMLYLIERGLLDTPILYLSGYIIENKSKYYKKLLKVTTEGAWVEWVEYFLNAISATSIWTMSKILSIQELIEESSSFIKSKAPSIYRKEFVELLFIQPYIRIQDLAAVAEIGRDTASKHLKILCQIGFLAEVKRGKDKLFINHKFLSLLKKK